MPSTWAAWKSKFERRRGQEAPPKPILPTSTSTSKTPSDPSSFRHETSPRSLQARIWNQAYDELKVNESKVVGTYEKLLTAELRRDISTSTNASSQGNEIEQAPEGRWRQMEQLVQAGLERIQMAVDIKEGIERGMQAAYTVKETVGKAVQASPEAALAWVGVCFALEILLNPITQPGINRRGMAYVVSRMDWYWNLVDLLLDENLVDGLLEELRGQLENHVVQLYKKLLLYQMKSVSIYYQSQGTVFLRDMFKLDDWEGKLDEIRHAEDLVRKDIEEFNTERIRRHLQAIAITADSQEIMLRAIHSAILDHIKRQEQLHRNEEDKKCLRDLRVTDPRDDKNRIERSKGGLLRSSYRWILDHPKFQRWYNDNDPQSRLLWINGDPGKGKTMLLCGIIDELERNGVRRLSSFFCEAAEARRSDATAVLRGLIYSLIDHQPSLISYVRAKYDNTGKQLFEDENAWEVLSRMLTAMLDDPSSDGGVIIIIDALDECRTRLPQLLGFITQATSSSRAKWIMSSRNWPSIEERLDNAQTVSLCLELNQDSISAAVSTYIRYKVGQLAQLKKYDAQTQAAVQQHLVNNANNTFLWVAVICQELENIAPWNAITAVKAFPPGLDPLYWRMMEHIHNSDSAELCRRILAVMSVLYRPVTLEELSSLDQTLEDVSPPYLPNVIRSCGSLLTLREGTVYFTHQSAKEFLLDKASDRILPSGLAFQHHIVFSRALEVLSTTLRRDLYSLSAPGFPIKQVYPPNPDPLAPARYSCIYWVDHLGDSDVARGRRHDEDLLDDGIIHTFLQKKYLYWLEALSLLRSVSEGAMAIQKLETLIDNVESRQLAKLLEDARRFILFHRRAVELAPLQVYATALVFSPTRSLVRRLFENEAPDCLISKPKMDEDWNACLQTLEGHTGWVYSVALSGDGRRLASGSHDNTIKLWNASAGDYLRTLQGHESSVWSVALSGDGGRLVSGSHDGTVKVWDTTTSACLQTLRGHRDSICSVTLSGDGKLLASGSYDKMVKLWAVTEGIICLKTLEGHTDLVTSVAFSGDGRRLASGSFDNTVKIWDSTTGACLQTLEHDSSVGSVTLSRDGHRLASGSHNEMIKIWDTTTGTCLKSLEGHKHWVESVALSADGRRLASGSYDGTVKIWDMTTGACQQTFEDHDGPVNSVAMSGDGQRLVSGSHDQTVKIWDASTDACLQATKGHEHEGLVKSVALSRDGQRLASGSDDNMIKIWAVATGACLQKLRGHKKSVVSIALSADGGRLASGSHDETIKIWDTSTGAHLRTFEGHHNSVISVAFSRDTRHLISVSYNETIKIWDLATGACLQTLKGHCGLVRSVILIEDSSRLVALGLYDNTVEIWDASTGCYLQTFKGHAGWVKLVALSEDGQHLASSDNESIKIWDSGTGTCLLTLSVNRPLTQLSFNPRSNSHLSTNIGVLSLGLPSSTPPVQSANISLRDVSHCGYGISLDGRWIVKDTEAILWLPLDYRPESSAVVLGSVIAIGCRSGRVLAMRFQQ